MYRKMLLRCETDSLHEDSKNVRTPFNGERELIKLYCLSTIIKLNYDKTRMILHFKSMLENGYTESYLGNSIAVTYNVHQLLKQLSSARRFIIL